MAVNILAHERTEKERENITDLDKAIARDFPDTNTWQSKKTLRDEFAMAALSAISSLEFDDIENPEEMALACYKLADAMMIAREVK